MASNFQIFREKNNSGIVLKLFGDFDATSAFELIDTLKKRSDDPSKVFIQTDGLKNVYPFGLDIFRKSLRAMNGQSARIVFTGDKTSGLSPDP